DPHELESPAVAFAVLGVAILLELFSFRTAIREANPVRRGRSWWTFIRTSKAPELPVVLLEDLGALCGLVFALVGVALTVATGDELFDAVGSISIGVLLGIIAIVLAVEMKSLLIGEAADPEEEAAILGVLEDSPKIERVIHLRTLHLGPDDILVAAKVEPTDGTVDDFAATVDQLEREIRTVLPGARRIYIEPDEFSPAAAAAGVDDPSPAAATEGFTHG